MKIRARHFETLAPVEVVIDGTTVSEVSDLKCSAEEAASFPIIAPGFYDIQINGYNGTWFCVPGLTVEQVVDVNQSLVNCGIARYFPTLVTASFEALHHGFSTLRKACEENEVVDASIAGYHLEGPYISSVDGPRGAHPVQHVRPADYDEFSRLQEASGDRIRLVTLAAESENAVPFIERCRRDGVVVSIGHTAATADQITAAADAGATLSTHLGNGAHGTLPRHPNYIWDQLAEDRLWASVIADGCHIPKSVLNCFLKCKTSQKTILTCDASGFAGCRPGTYREGDFHVEVLDDARIVVAGQRQFLAGSGATTGDCVVHMSHVCDLPLKTTVAMATKNPATLMGEDAAEVSIGAVATFSLFDVESSDSSRSPRFVPVATIVDGKQLSNASEL